MAKKIDWERVKWRSRKLLYVTGKQVGLERYADRILERDAERQAKRK